MISTKFEVLMQRCNNLLLSKGALAADTLYGQVALTFDPSTSVSGPI